MTPWVPSLTPNKSFQLRYEHFCNLHLQEVAAGGSDVQVHPWLPSTHSRPGQPGLLETVKTEQTKQNLKFSVSRRDSLTISQVLINSLKPYSNLSRHTYFSSNTDTDCQNGQILIVSQKKIKNNYIIFSNKEKK